MPVLTNVKVFLFSTRIPVPLSLKDHSLQKLPEVYPKQWLLSGMCHLNALHHTQAPSLCQDRSLCSLQYLALLN